MARIAADDGVKLAYAEAGEGFPILFVHEFAGDMRSWEPQLRFFARRYRAIAFNARGYTPSDVPDEQAAYSQARATDDIAAVLRGLGIARAHIVGLSMGAFATLHFGLHYPEMAASLTAGGVGYGAGPAAVRTRFQTEVEATAAAIRKDGMAKTAIGYSRGPARLQFLAKDPRGHAEFQAMLAEHSTEGSALTMMGVQRGRPNLYDLKAEFARLKVPVLIIAGDEDEPTLEPALWLKRTIPSAGLVMVPRTGHTINLEEPDLFNRATLDFITAVESGRWTARDPATQTGAIVMAEPAKAG